MATLSNNVGTEVCALFGFNPKTTRRVEIIFQSGDIVHVNATIMADRDEVDSVFEIVKRYKLVPREEAGDGGIANAR